MHVSTRSTIKSLLRGVSWLLFVSAGLAFWWGGRAISESAKTERMLAEMEGITLAPVCAGLGALAKAAADHLDDGENPGLGR
jgi:hypothetical protein